jgi:type 1 glutamine amidotransferase
MGHHANLFHSSEFKKMFANAILWAAGTNKKKPPVSGRFLSLKTKETD